MQNSTEKSFEDGKNEQIEGHSDLSVVSIGEKVYIGELDGYRLLRPREVHLEGGYTVGMLAHDGIVGPGIGKYIGDMGQVLPEILIDNKAAVLPANMEIWQKWYQEHSWGTGKFDEKGNPVWN